MEEVDLCCVDVQNEENPTDKMLVFNGDDELKSLELKSNDEKGISEFSGVCPFLIVALN